MNKKGVLLYSGGLDSLLAAKILLDQKIDLIGLQFILPFTPPDCEYQQLESAKYAESVNLNLEFIRCGHEYMKMVKNPPHGRGKNMNPCIDCKIFFLSSAKERMEKENASFVATGEVIGQRPMSQMKHMLRHIEKASGLDGNLLRPLSAKLLPPTNAETGGAVNRELLYSFSGRSRNPQMELAKKLGIEKFSSPAGGCLLTDKNISLRVMDLLEYSPDYSMADVYLLTIGRHYRLHDRAKIIVSRNEKENIELEKYMKEADYFLIPEFKGPLLYACGELNDKDFELLASIAGRYGKDIINNNKIIIKRGDENFGSLSVSSPATDYMLDRLRI